MEPELNYLRNEPNVVNLVKLRMDPSSPLQRQRFSINMSSSSGIKVKDAEKIEGALKTMRVSENVSIKSQA